jgi:gamma-glutamyltranspeptidase / glutathione hydrolase
LSLLIAFALPAGAQERHREPYVPFPADKVYATVAEHGVVVAQEKIAAQIGADILRHKAATPSMPRLPPVLRWR